MKKILLLLISVVSLAFTACTSKNDGLAEYEFFDKATNKSYVVKVSGDVIKEPNWLEAARAQMEPKSPFKVYVYLVKYDDGYYYCLVNMASEEAMSDKVVFFYHLNGTRISSDSDMNLYRKLYEESKRETLLCPNVL